MFNKSNSIKVTFYFIMPLRISRFSEGCKLWFVHWIFAGLAAFRKMLHGVWGRELPQDNVRSTPHACGSAPCLTGGSSALHARVVQKLFRVDFCAGKSFCTTLACSPCLMPGIA